MVSFSAFILINIYLVYQSLVNGDAWFAVLAITKFILAITAFTLILALIENFRAQKNGIKNHPLTDISVGSLLFYPLIISLDLALRGDWSERMLDQVTTRGLYYLVMAGVIIAASYYAMRLIGLKRGKKYYDNYRDLTIGLFLAGVVLNFFLINVWAEGISSSF